MPESFTSPLEDCQRECAGILTSPLKDCHSLRLWKIVKESVPESFTSPLDVCQRERTRILYFASERLSFTSPLEDCQRECVGIIYFASGRLSFIRLWKTVKGSVPELFTSPLQEDPGYLTVVVPASSVRCGDLGPLPEADETA